MNTEEKQEAVILYDSHREQNNTEIANDAKNEEK